MSSFYAHISALNISINDIYGAFAAHGVTPPRNLASLESASSKSSLIDRMHRYADDGGANGAKLPLAVAYYADDVEIKICAQDHRDGQGFREIYYQHKLAKGGDVSSIVTSIDVRRAAKLEAKDPLVVSEQVATSKRIKLEEGIRKFAKGKGGMESNRYLTEKGFEDLLPATYALYADWSTLIIPMGARCEVYKPQEQIDFESGKIASVPLKLSFKNLEAFSVKAQFEDSSPIRVNYGSAGDKFFFFGKLSSASRIIICEGIATGIAILESIGTDKVCLICSCGSKKEAKFWQNIRRDFRLHGIKKSRCDVVVCADNDWVNKVGVNAGIEFGNRAVEELRDFGARMVAAPVEGHLIPDIEKPMTDFCDMYQFTQGGAEEIRKLVCNGYVKSVFDGLYNTNTPYPVVNAYHASSAEPKMDLTNFPDMFLEYINETFKDARPEQLGACIMSQLAHDLGLVGSQLFTEAPDKRKYCAIFVTMVAESTAGKTFAMHSGKHLVNKCMNYVCGLLDSIKQDHEKDKRAEKKAAKRADAAARGQIMDPDAEQKYENLVRKIDNDRRTIDFLQKCYPEVQNSTLAALDDSLSVQHSLIFSGDEYEAVDHNLRRQNGGESMNTTLITYLDSGSRARRTKNNGTTYVKDACVSFCMGATSSSLSRCVSRADIKSGLLSRIIFVTMPVQHREAKGIIPCEEVPHKESAAIASRYGSRIICLWRSVIDGAVSRCRSGEFDCGYRQGVKFYAKDISKLSAEEIDIYNYKRGNDLFFEYFNREIVRDLSDVEVDIKAIKSRCEENFLRLSPMFQLMLMDDGEFEEKMLHAPKDDVVDIANDSDDVEGARGLAKHILNAERGERRPTPPKTLLSERAALCAGAVVKYACECAKIAYPQFLNKAAVAAQNARPTEAAVDLEVLRGVCKELAERGLTLSYQNIIRHQSMRENKKRVSATPLIITALEDGLLEFADGSLYEDGMRFDVKTTKYRLGRDENIVTS